MVEIILFEISKNLLLLIVASSLKLLSLLYCTAIYKKVEVLRKESEKNSPAFSCFVLRTAADFSERPKLSVAKAQPRLPEGAHEVLPE